MFGKLLKIRLVIPNIKPYEESKINNAGYYEKRGNKRL